MPRRLHLLWSLPLLLVGCRPDTVDLAYRFPEGAREYRMEARMAARSIIGEAGEGSCRVVFDVTENVRETDGETAVVAVTMETVDVEERDLPCPRTESFTLRIDRDGGVIEVLEVNGVDATRLSPDEVAFIGTYRPKLPPGPVALGDEWRAEAGSEAQLATTAELESLYRDDDGPVAEIAYAGAGPLRWVFALPQGTANLTGSAETAGAASFDIEDGVLRSATSSLDGVFEVRVTSEAGSGRPVTGSMDLELDVTVEAKG